MKTANPWIEFWKKFARMLDGGIPILTALQTLWDEMQETAIRETCRTMLDQVKEGHAISSAMEKLPDLFVPSVVKIIQAGELSGTLDKAMLSVAAGIEDGSFPPPASAAAVSAAILAETSPAPTELETRDVPVVRFVAKLLKEAVEQKVSDVHIESTPEGLRLRYRQGGVLRAVQPPPKELANRILRHVKIMASIRPDKTPLPQDGRIIANIRDESVDFSVSVFPTVKGESLVLRVVQGKTALVSLEQMFADEHLKRVQTWLAEPRGLIMTNGPVGSGKTTALYAMLAACDAERNKIITIEDPVEHPLDGVCQQQARYDQGLTVAKGLRSILRQAPDIIMASEIRDLETVTILIQAALTGHLVMTSLHTENSLSAVRRLLDIGIEPFMIFGTPVRVISQRLVRRICPDCKAERILEPWMRDLYPADAIPKCLYHGNGCKKCHDTGYRGRIAVYEVWQPPYDVVTRLAKGESPAEVMAAAKAAGLVTLRAHGLTRRPRAKRRSRKSCGSHRRIPHKETNAGLPCALEPSGN